jgi:MFS family permease
MSEYVTLLRQNRDYRFLWLASVVSQLGDWFNLIASAALIARLTGTETAISYLFLARFVPLFLFSPLAGVLADRYDRRYVMIGSDLLRAVTVAGFLLIREPEQVWLLYTLTIVQFALSAIFTPSRTAVLANVVTREELVPANALDSLTWSTMLALGALIGGLVASIFGISEAFILDAITFLLAALLVSRIRRPVTSDSETGVEAELAPELASELTPQSGADSGGGWFEFLEGLRYLRGQSFILGLSLVKSAGSLAWGAINVLEITFAAEIFPLELPQEIRMAADIDAGTASLGLIYAVSGLGTGLGPILIRRWLGDEPIRMRWAILAGFGFMATGIFLLATAQTLGIFTIGTLIRTVGSGTIWVFSAALLQMIVPDQFRGRVFAFEFAVVTLTQSISSLWAGFAQDDLGLGLRQVALSMSLVSLAMGLIWAAFHLRYIYRPAESQVER